MQGFWKGFEKRAFAYMHFVHHADLTDDERKHLHSAASEVGAFRNSAAARLLKKNPGAKAELGGRNNWAEDAVAKFHEKHPESKSKVWVGGTLKLSDKAKPHPFHTEILAVNDVNKNPKAGGAEYYANHVGVPHKTLKSEVMGKKYRQSWGG